MLTSGWTKTVRALNRFVHLHFCCSHSLSCTRNMVSHTVLSHGSSQVRRPLRVQTAMDPLRIFDTHSDMLTDIFTQISKLAPEDLRVSQPIPIPINTFFADLEDVFRLLFLIIQWLYEWISRGHQPAKMMRQYANLIDLIFRFSTIALQYLPKYMPIHVSNALLLIRAKLAWLILFHWAPNSAAIAQWRRRLTCFDYSWQSLSWSLMDSPYAVYLMLAMDTRQPHRFAKKARLFYIGSTRKTVFGRFHSRLRKLHQLQQHKFVKAELALHYWVRTSSFFDFVLLPVVTADAEHEVRLLELNLISRWQPPLNYPFCNHIQLRASGIKHQRLPTRHHQSIASSRLHKKIRRRLSAVHCPFSLLTSFSDSVQSLWQTLLMLAGDNLTSFRAQAFLRRHRVHQLHLYALLRLSNNLEQPWRSRVKSHIAKIFRVKNLALPGTNSPFRTCPLSHPEFQYGVRQFLRQIIRKSEHRLLPLHVPSRSILFRAHVSLHERLFNFQETMREFSLNPGRVPSCPCKSFLPRHPHLEMHNGHIASPAEFLSISPQLKAILQYSAASQILPSKRTYSEEFRKDVARWADKHCLNMDDAATHDFLEGQWPLHLNTVHEDCITWQAVSSLRPQLQGLTIHCQDHQPFRTMLYCPLLYYNAVKATFTETTIFERVSIPPSKAQDLLHTLIPDSLLQRYPWAFRLDLDLPRGYTLLQHKKSFAIGRSIVAYRNTPPDDVIIA